MERGGMGSGRRWLISDGPPPSQAAIYTGDLAGHYMPGTTEVGCRTAQAVVLSSIAMLDVPGVEVGLLRGRGGGYRDCGLGRGRANSMVVVVCVGGTVMVREGGFQRGVRGKGEKR